MTETLQAPVSTSPEKGSPTPPPRRGIVNFLQEFSIPLIAGVLAALVAANLDYDGYHLLVDAELVPFELFGHPLTLHFLFNDIFMVFFFGIAAKEITEAALPGGSLNPLRNAINPLFATVGGVVGPVAVFFGGLYLLQGAGAFGEGAEWGPLARGWGVPTATDIALAWLVARAVFGKGHAAVNYLLLLAVADDAIGLGIIAIFYGDPAYPAQPQWLLLVALGMGTAFAMRKANVRSWLPYVFIAGTISWCGLILAHLHPALALVFVVPFLPGPVRDTGLFVEKAAGAGGTPEPTGHGSHGLGHSPLENFEHHLKVFVDFGLFFFAFCNAGVKFDVIGPMTWLILGSLVVGKTLGIGLMGLLARVMGFPLPRGMCTRTLFLAGFVAALGLTVALFVAGAAFPDPILLGQAKMGALFSGFVGIAALFLGRLLGVGRGKG
jgi:NhaA family Na+:H+ antiporter